MHTRNTNLFDDSNLAPSDNLATELSASGAS